MSSLFDWAGGEAAFMRLINAFYDRVEADEVLSPVFPGGVREEHRLHVIAWWRMGGARRRARRDSLHFRTDITSVVPWLVVSASRSGRMGGGQTSLPDLR
jgi:Bacterial-like globin